MTTTHSKAANGAGTVFRLANGRWRAAIVGLDGKRVTRTRTTENQAKKALRELLTARDDMAKGGVITPASLTVANVLDAWLTLDLPNRNRAPGTVYAYDAAATRIKNEIGNHKVATLRVPHLDAAFQRMGKDGRMAKATLHKTRNVLAMAFDYANKREEMVGNKARSITLPTDARASKVSKALNVEQAKKLMEEASGHRWGALFITALNLGLRPGELTALCWDHVDLDGGTITIGRGVRRERSGRPYLSDEVKTTRARRTLRMPSNVLDAMKAHKAQQMADDMATGVRSDLVFRTSVGTLIAPRNLARELQTLTNAVGLGDKWTPNELRHSAASLLVDQGVPLVTVADILGHTTTRMLEMTYRKQLRPTIDGAVIAMDNLFGSAANA